MDDDSVAQGVHEIQRAACGAVADHLDSFQYSLAEDNLWENHPLLVESEADKAGILANLIARTLRDLLRLLAPADPALYRDEQDEQQDD